MTTTTMTATDPEMLVGLQYAADNYDAAMEAYCAAKKIYLTAQGKLVYTGQILELARTEAKIAALTGAK